jgi:ribosomal protein S18 acetylase RimI-like enzyme
LILTKGSLDRSAHNPQFTPRQILVFNNLKRIPMRQATFEDKDIVVDILVQSFQDNRSVNYIIPQGHSREKRSRRLMRYSFDYCQLFGQVFLSDDNKACALLVYPDKKKISLKSIGLDINLAFGAIGLPRIRRALRRESIINALHPNPQISYLWFIGVIPTDQNQGKGSDLMNQIVQHNKDLKREIFLETSTEQNISFYRKFGFQIYKELDFGYKLYCLKRV